MVDRLCNDSIRALVVRWSQAPGFIPGNDFESSDVEMGENDEQMDVHQSEKDVLKPFDKTDQLNLFKETDLTRIALKQLRGQNAKQTREKVCKYFLLEIKKKLGEKNKLNQFAEWIAANTLYQEGKLEGAYKYIHKLFQTIAKLKRKPDALKRNSSLRKCSLLSTLRCIDLTALNLIESSKRPLSNIEDIDNNLFKYVDLKSVLSLRQTSKYFKDKAEKELMTKINLGKISVKKLGLKSFDSLVTYLGETNCAQIKKLDLKDFGEITEEIIECIQNKFPKVMDLSLHNCTINDGAAQKLEYLSELTSLDIQGCKNLTTLKFVKGLKNLINFNISRCTGLKTGFDSLKSCEKLENFDVSYCKQIERHDYFKYFPLLKSLNASHCNLTDEDFSFLQKKPNAQFWENLSSLNIANCRLLKNFQILKDLSSIKILDVSFCKQIEDFAFLDFLPNLEELKLLGKWEFEDPYFLQLCHRLKHLSVGVCTEYARSLIRDYSNERGIVLVSQ